MTSHLPPFDLSVLRSQFGSDPAKERAALLALARAALSGERYEDLMRLAKEIVRAAAAATPGADITPEERQIFFTATKQVREHNQRLWWTLLLLFASLSDTSSHSTLSLSLCPL